MGPKALRAFILLFTSTTTLLIYFALFLPWWNIATIETSNNNDGGTASARARVFLHTNATEYRAEYGLWGFCLTDIRIHGVDPVPQERYCFSFFFKTHTIDVPCGLVQRDAQCSGPKDVRTVGHACANSFRQYVDHHESDVRTDAQTFLDEACGSLGKTTLAFAIILTVCITLCTVCCAIGAFYGKRRRALFRVAAWCSVFALCGASILLMLWLSLAKPLRGASSAVVFGTAYYLHLLNSLLLLGGLLLIAQYFKLPREAFRGMVEDPSKSPASTTYTRSVV